MSECNTYELRQMRASDRLAIASLLTDLETKYPGGNKWLDRRFDDVLLGRAAGIVTTSRKKIVGASIVTPKGKRAAKISTIKVEEGFRRQGIAGTMLAHIKDNWLALGIERAWVTVDARDLSTLRYLTAHAGFEEFVQCHDRYGEGRDESILTWSPESEYAAFARTPLVDQTEVRRAHFSAAEAV